MASKLTIEQAVASILGDEAADRITGQMGLYWAVVYAMAAATTAEDPRAIAAIREYNAGRTQA